MSEQLKEIFSRWTIIEKLRMEAQKEIISENLVGLEFATLLYESRPVVQLTRLTEEMGLYDLEYDKGKQ